MTKNKTFGKVFVSLMFIISLVICILLADMFSSLITANTFSTTESNAISLNQYSLYAVSLHQAATKAEASEKAEEVYVQNGAGFILYQEGVYNVIASAYENKADAESVQNNLKSSGIDSTIINISIKPINITGNFSAADKTIGNAALQSFKKCYKKLYDLSVSLDTKVLSEEQTKLSVNEIYAEQTKVKNDYDSVFNTKLTSTILSLSVKLTSSLEYLQQLVNIEKETPLQTYSSLIKLTYMRIVRLYSELNVELSSN